MNNEELLQVIEKAARDGVKELNLSHNQLTSLPPEIGQLTKLTQLDLSNNHIASLPTEIGQLTNLTWLDLSDNPLPSLPSEIGQLTNLIWLIITTSHTIVPGLYGHNNPLSELPSEFGRLNNLVRLDLTSNQLASLPLELGQLANLKELKLGNNPIQNLFLEIGKLTNLTWLDLSYNQLTSLPPEIGRLTRLKFLNLLGNPLSIPPEILGKANEPATIINYYLELLRGQKKPLNEAKMLLVGQGNVGKTSLVKRLVDSTYNPHENKTEGINIQPWQIQVNDQSIQLNIWDFGGQEIMHATHQFFLTKRSLYLLVLDARLGEQENRLDYWLKIIQSFSDDSPVIIVGNKIDQHPLDINRRGLENKYPNIKAILETSCQDKIGIDNLQQAIITEISQLNHIHDPLLLSWFTVKKQLEEMDRDYIPYTDYEKMCQDEGITDNLSQRTLMGFLHDLGVVLNFQDEPRLEETNILNPEWVTNGVYKILNDNLLMTQYKGILEREQLNRILDPQKYPKNKHLFIIDMMRKFELCFDLELDKKFLIPDLLPKEEPDTGEWDDSLGFQYHYPVLPSSIISRFIVRMNHRISKNTYWRSGVILANHENRALVKADKDEKKIFILIKGTEKGRRNFLNLLRDDFEAIHKTIPGIQAEEKVALPNHPDIVVDYKHLLNLEELGERDYIPPGLKEKVNVKALLDGIESEEKRREKQKIDGYEKPNQPIVKTTETNSEKSKPNKINWTIVWAAIAAIGTLLGGLAVIIPLLKGNNNSTPSPSQSPDTELNKKSTSSPKIVGWVSDRVTHYF